MKIRTRQRRPRGPRAARGFTLLEMLVAVAILSLLVAVTFGAVRTASRSLDAGLQRADATEELRSVADFLRRQLAQLTPLRVPVGDEARIAFRGDAERLRFIAPAPQHARGPGLLVFELELTRDAGRTGLALSSAPFDPGSAAFADVETGSRMLLAPDLGAAVFDYFGAEFGDDRPSWKPGWISGAELYPSLVRLRVADSQSAAGWPELVFAVNGQVAR